MKVSIRKAKKWKSRGRHRTYVEKRGRQEKQIWKDYEQ